MSLLSESLTIGLLLTLVFGALFFYLYSRVSYAEKRVSLMEGILIDLKIKEEQHHMHLPKVPSHMTFNDAVDTVHMPVFAPTIPVETHNEVETLPTEQINTNERPIEELYSEVLNNDAPLPVIEEVKEESAASVGVNYEAMTKDELIEIAKKKGINLGNRPGREKVLKLIRQSEGLVPEDNDN